MSKTKDVIARTLRLGGPDLCHLAARGREKAGAKFCLATCVGELLECFQWSADADAERVKEELADVLTYCMLLAQRIGADPEQIVREKLAITREKYPVETSRGRSTKYDAL